MQHTLPVLFFVRTDATIVASKITDCSMVTLPVTRTIYFDMFNPDNTPLTGLVGQISLVDTNDSDGGVGIADDYLLWGNSIPITDGGGGHYTVTVAPTQGVGEVRYRLILIHPTSQAQKEFILTLQDGVGSIRLQDALDYIPPAIVPPGTVVPSKATVHQIIDGVNDDKFITPKGYHGAFYWMVDELERDYDGWTTASQYASAQWAANIDGITVSNTGAPTDGQIYVRTSGYASRPLDAWAQGGLNFTRGTQQYFLGLNAAGTAPNLWKRGTAGEDTTARVSLSNQGYFGGLFVDGSDVWVVNASDRRLEKWRLSGGEDTTARVSLPNQGYFGGVFVDGSDVWIVNDTNNRIEKWSLTTKTEDTSARVQLGNKTWEGLWIVGTNAYALNHNDRRIEKWSLTTKTEDTSARISLSSGIEYEGIVIEGDAIYVLNDTNDRIEMWALDNSGETTGARLSLSSGKTYRGLTFDDGAFWTCNDTDNRIEKWSPAWNTVGVFGDIVTDSIIAHHFTDVDEGEMAVVGKGITANTLDFDVPSLTWTAALVYRLTGGDLRMLVVKNNSGALELAYSTNEMSGGGSASESTQAQAEAGTDDATANATRMTPRRTKQAIEAQVIPHTVPFAALFRNELTRTAVALGTNAANELFISNGNTKPTGAPDGVTDFLGIDVESDQVLTMLNVGDWFRVKRGENFVIAQIQHVQGQEGTDPVHDGLRADDDVVLLWFNPSTDESETLAYDQLGTGTATVRFYRQRTIAQFREILPDSSADKTDATIEIGDKLLLLTFGAITVGQFVAWHDEHHSGIKTLTGYTFKTANPSSAGDVQASVSGDSYLIQIKPLNNTDKASILNRLIDGRTFTLSLNATNHLSGKLTNNASELLGTISFNIRPYTLTGALTNNHAASLSLQANIPDLEQVIELIEDDVRAVTPKTVTQFTAGNLTLDGTEQDVATATITPASTARKILIQFNATSKGDRAGSATPNPATTTLKLYRGSTLIRTETGEFSTHVGSVLQQHQSVIMMVDEPSTTAATTYKITAQRDTSLENAGIYNRSLILMEVN